MEALTKESFASLPTAEQVACLEQVDARTRQQLILSSQNSLSLTRGLSSEKLFYTLKEIGLADAVDLLALASPEQVRDMVDLDCWRKDELDDRRLLTWLMFLDEAGSSKLAEWALHVDIELVVLLVRRHFEIVRKAEIEEDLNFNQTLYFTFDDQYLLRFIGEEEPILALLLERIRVLDYETYKRLLEWSLLELDSSLEEDSLRWRNARLADRGYPSYDEAQTLFRFMTPAAVLPERYQRATATKVRYAADEEFAPADHALMLIDGDQDSLLVRALSALSPEVTEQVGHELAMLTNETAVAEACDLGELAEVRKCAEEVHDYVNIGLAQLAHENEAEAARLLSETLLRPFFQVGVGVTLRLQQGARELDVMLRHRIGDAWEDWLDSPFREVCANARRHPPVFFRGLETPGEIFFRRFRNIIDVKKVEAVLNVVPVWFEVLQRWQLLPDRYISEQISLAILWNTAFARWILKNEIGTQPLKRSEVSLFQKKVRPSSVDGELNRFLAFLTVHLSLTAEEIEAMKVLASFAREKLSEALAVDAETVDLRFLDGVLIDA
ncbi:MAG: DUF6178 family protein [Candidatus Binatia bacterium]